MNRSHAEQRRATRIKRKLVRQYERGELSGHVLTMVLMINDWSAA